MQTSPSASTWQRADTLALWGGIAFSFVFTALIAWAGQYIDRSMLWADQGVAWYYWKLPPTHITFWTRASAWGLYLLHQLANFGLIYYAQTRVKTYATGLHNVNIAALAINALFVVLHFVQTHVWYDALAQDVSIFSSQGAVIVLLVWVLLMENNRRGLFFGYKMPFSQQVIQAARKYHGYLFSWAAIYTFWYHPMENTSGHLVGFFYTFLLMLQGSLFLTRIHINKWWMLTQEVTVLFHGTLVAWTQAGAAGFWPMFFFGFAGIFIITQMHGLGLSLRARWVWFAAYVLSVVGVYTFRGWGNLNEIIRIPLIDYVLVFALAGIIWVTLKVTTWFRQPMPKATPVLNLADLKKL